MIGRRVVLAMGLAGPALARPAADEEMPLEPWFVESFLDLREDLATAVAGGRHLVVVWGLRGCPPCIELHRTTLVDPRVIAFVPAHFDVVALDFAGARMVIFPDGTSAAEKAMARRQGIDGPPVFQVFDRDGRERHRLEGFAPADEFLAFFRAIASAA